MKSLFKYLCLAFAIFYICRCKADDNPETRRFIESCYGAAYDLKTELTDVVLVNARYTNQVQIAELANKVIEKYKRITNSAGWDNWLEDVFAESSMSNNANIQFFRERKANGYYRLDAIPDLETFARLDWNEGLSTNTTRLMLTTISIPPTGTNKLWTLYDIQPNASRLAIQAGVIPRTDFYDHLAGMPSLFMGNIMLRTSDASAIKTTTKNAEAENGTVNRSPYDYSWFQIDEKRLDQVLGDKGIFQHWGVRPLANDIKGFQQLSVVGTNGIDRDMLRVIFDKTDPKQRYLAYMRDPDNTIIALFAWDYGTGKIPVRFLRIEQLNGSELVAWAQNLTYVNKTTNIDWSIFNVDLTKFSSVYDKRPEFPIQTVNGKVVFDARKDSYADTPKGIGANKTNWFDRRNIIRAIIFTVFLLPPFIMIFMAIKKRISK